MADDYFTSEFNKRLGNVLGRRATVPSDRVRNLDLATRLENLRITREAEERAKEYAKEGRPSEEGGPGFEPVLGNLTQPTLNAITKAAADKKFMGINFPNVWEIPGPVGKALGPIDEALIGLNVQAPLKIGSTALDLLARPAYGLFESMQEQAESSYAGESITNQLKRMGTGFWAGLSGKEKTGYGDVVETYTNAPDDIGGGFLQDLMDASIGGLPRMVSEKYLEPGNDKGWVNTWAKRGLGLGGEVFLDPTNLVGGKVIGSMRYGDAVMDFADDAYRKMAKDAFREAVDKKGWAAQFNLKRPKGFITDPVTGKKTPIFQTGHDLVEEIGNKSIDDSMLQVGGGATRGRVIGGQVSPYAVANNMGIATRNYHLTEYEKLRKILDDAILSGNPLSSSVIKNMRKNPYMAQHLDELLAVSRKTRSATTYADIEAVLADYIRRPSKSLANDSFKVSASVKKTLDDDVLDIQNHIFDTLAGKVFNAPGIKIGGKVIPFRRIGEVYTTHKASRSGLTKGLQYGEQFIGRTPAISQRVRSLGMAKYEEFHKQVIAVAKGLTKEERRAVHQHILDQTPFIGNQRLQDAKDFVEQAYKEMWQLEIDAGVRSSREIQAPNYAFNYYRGSDVRNKIKYLKDESKIYLNRTGKIDPSLPEKAAAQGLKPETDAFRALLYRKLDSNRKLTRAWFKSDLLNNYGIMANQLSPELASQMKLVPQFSGRRAIPKDISDRLGLLQRGDNWYLPRDINDVFEKYAALAGGGKSSDLEGLLRLFDKWTRYFKTSATIPWPGFHIRNGIGDIFMSWIDGVRTRDIEFLKKWQIRAARNPSAAIDITGGNKTMHFTFDEMRKIFRENASSGGYQNVELVGAGAAATLDPRSIGNLARRASGAREDLFRFSHFLHAFREELPKALKEVKNTDRALQRAIDASTYRVNKYLFDYGALTKFEQTFLKRIFPFYTYTRKAMPTLMEGLFLHPSQFAKTQRLFLDSDDGSYPDMLTPGYQREIGYARLSDEDDAENPWILGGQFLPTDVLNRNMNFSSAQGFAQALTQQVNPFAKAPFELAGGTQYFNDAPIESTGGYFSNSIVPPLRPIEDVGGFKLEFESPFMPPSIGEGRKSGWLEKLGAGRIGLGLPFDKVVEAQQSAAAQGLLDQVESRLERENEGLAKNGYKLFLSKRADGTTYRIRRLVDDEVIYETRDPNAALARAQRLSGM